MSLSRRVLRVANRFTSLGRHLCFDADRRLEQLGAASRGTQILLQAQYRQLRHSGCPLPRFEDVALRVCSQNGEDGVLLFIFALIGTLNKRAVELCAGNGVECNTANLVTAHGWSSLMVDGDEENVRFGNEYYRRNRDTFLSPPRLVHAWVTAETVDQLLLAQGVPAEIDLLSLDLDGVDYWVWQAISAVRPRVVVAEFNSVLGPARSTTVPYSPDFRSPHMCYGGASLAALAKLARQKGYRLVGCERQGVNAFFIADGVGEECFPEVSPEACFDVLRRVSRYEERFREVAHLPWVEV